MKKLLLFDSNGLLPKPGDGVCDYFNRSNSILEKSSSAKLEKLVKEEFGIQIVEEVSQKIFDEAVRIVKSKYDYNLGWAKAYYAILPKYPLIKERVLGHMISLYCGNECVIPPIALINCQNVNENNLFPTLVHELLHIPMSFIHKSNEGLTYQDEFAESIFYPTAEMQGMLCLLKQEFKNNAGYVLGRLNAEEASLIKSGFDPKYLIKSRARNNLRMYLISERLNF